ncbi:MAG: 2-dehydropantoate 2-reductase [Verrucomicrobiales bacterium]|nr:MAG: 2-dehydropantoate 2-reductase [Verrucomicrobiota bacterium]
MTNPRIVIVGCGAVGLFYGAKLALSGQDVHFLMRQDFDQVSKYGIKIESASGEAEYLENPSIYRDALEIGPCDLIIVAIKSTDNKALESLIPKLIKKETAIMTLQNGLGNEEFIAKKFGSYRVLGGLCFVCLNRVSKGVVRHIAQGTISCGEFMGLPLPRTHDVALMFKSAGIPFIVAESLIEQRWKKLVWNIPFNGISISEGGVDTSVILKDKSLLFLVEALMREVIQVANKLGYDLSNSLIDHNIKETKSMGPYRPSSMIDFMEGRPVEVEAIWGNPVRVGRSVGVEIPRMETLYDSIKSLSSTK